MEACCKCCLFLQPHQRGQTPVSHETAHCFPVAFRYFLSGQAQPPSHSTIISWFLKFPVSFHRISAALEQFYRKIYNNVRTKANYGKNSRGQHDKLAIKPAIGHSWHLWRPPAPFSADPDQLLSPYSLCFHFSPSLKKSSSLIIKTQTCWAPTPGKACWSMDPQPGPSVHGGQLWLWVLQKFRTKSHLISSAGIKYIWIQVYMLT